MNRVSKIFFFILFFGMLANASSAQELFPNAEAASNVGKHVLRTELANEIFQEYSQLRLWQGYSFIFGISSKVELEETFSFSNHHSLVLPNGFIYRNSLTGNLQTTGYILGQPHPFWFENFSVTCKYRFLNLDGNHSHLRAATYLQLAGGNEDHPESEPSLLGDNSGAAFGLITTYLKNKFAVSLKLGGIFPYKYQQFDSNIVIKYSNALYYCMSFGYLLLPRNYSEYKQVNVNVYMEFVGESYGAAVLTKNGESVYSAGIPSFGKGIYLEARPGIQCIFNSNTRISFSPAFPLISRSYVKLYPAYYVYVQHDFYL